ncbi:hypothetical protein C6W22_17410 [Bacillus atrophaeus]|nr:hypothetical protein C6W22_17410 [Bacillus atrophaeus]
MTRLTIITARNRKQANNRYRSLKRQHHIRLRLFFWFLDQLEKIDSNWSQSAPFSHIITVEFETEMEIRTNYRGRLP